MKMAETSQRSNVATSPRCDTPTSRRRDVGSTNIKSPPAATSRRLNVTMSQRRDVSASSVFSSLKEKGGGIRGMGDRTN